MSNVLSRGGQSSQDCPLLPELVTQLSKYITARSFKKMEHRFNNKSLSVPYFKALNQITMEQSIIHSGRNIGGNRDQMELESDKLFLEDFVISFAKEHGFIGLDIPNILKLASNLHSDDKILQLYSNETSVEFHRLLLYLLQKFQAALGQLTACDPTMATTKDTNAEVPDYKKIFDENIRNVYIYGYGLLRLSRGRAFQLHLANIEPLLRDALDLGDEEEDDHKEGDQERYDDELEEIRPTLPQNGVLPRSFTTWLRLMVAHFDATEIVARAIVKLNVDTVSVTILVAPETDNTLLPWRTLFSHPYLPNIDPGSDRDVPSHDDICAFLEEGISRAKAAKYQHELVENALKAWSSPRRSEVIRNFHLLAIDQGSDAKVHDVLSKIIKWETLLKQPSEKSNRKELSTDILSSIKKLKAELLGQCNRDIFFSNLENMSFKGTLHCEACLASLLPSFTKHFLSEDKYKEMNILSDLQVEYPHFSPFLSSNPHLFSCLLLGLWAGYWSVKTLLPMLCNIPQDPNVKPWRKFCSTWQPWQNFPVLPTTMDPKQHCGHDEHNVWTALAGRSCDPEKGKQRGFQGSMPINWLRLPVNRQF